MKIQSIVAVLCVCPALLGAEPVSVEEGAEVLATNAEKAREARAGMSYEAFRDSVPYVAAVGKWIVNGDVPIRNEKLLREFYEQNVRTAPPAPAEGATPEFTVMSQGGLDQVWNEDQKQALSYCVSTAFGGRYGTVVAEIEGATAAWEAAADLNFVHVASQDGDCTPANTNVLFDVGPLPSPSRFLAIAFFPNEPRPARTLRIDQSAFNLVPGGALTLRGILRHELGHVIGARHEHVRPDAGNCFEDDEWRGVTDYDAFSVMHYPQCNGLGDWTLTLTAADRSGVACIYGAAPGFVIDADVCEPATGILRLGPFTLAAEGTQTLDPIAVTPGHRLTVRLRGKGEAPGDPDLYLKFEAPALLTDFDCRPFETGAEEVCDVTVPAGTSVASVMVHAPRDAAFRLEVTGAAE